MKTNYLKFLGTILLLGGGTFTGAAQTILHVKANATGTNNGSSWTNAYNSLQSAITTVRANPATSYEIWVAGGTYKPTLDPSGNATPANAGDKTFYLVNGAKFYGGFAGTETALNQRNLNLVANASILSGDLNNSNSINNGDAYHVVLSVGATATTVFDGFTVTGGYSSLATPLTVAGQSLYRDAGAGMINGASSPTISNCIFSGNKSTGNGGGLFNASASTPSITYTRFLDNAASYGGGMYNLSSSPDISNCTFSGDTASVWGGGMLNNDASAPNISNTTFSGNRANLGAGIHTRSSSSPSISNVTFSGNIAGTEGGAIYSTLSSSPNISRSVFSGNTAANGGGIFIDGTTSYTITNCVFSGNKSSNAGGGIFLNTAQGTISNCTVSGNMSANIGGGLYYNNVAGGRIVNSIIYGNTTPNTTDANRKEIYKDGASVNPANALIINYSILKDYLNTITNHFTWGTGNTASDPLFVDPQPAGAAPTVLGNYQLRFCSAAINSGDPQTNNSGYTVQVGATDLIGNTRIHATTIDMGAYEKQGDLTNLGSNAALSNSGANGIAFLPTCLDNDNWTWYAPANNPDSLSFAIKWGTTNSAAQAAAAVYLTVKANHFVATNTTNRAIVTMKRFWNVDMGTSALVTPVSIRFLYDAADTIAMRNQASALNVGPAHNLVWFNTNGAPYDTSLVTPTHINNGNYTELNPVYGAANNVPYVQFDNLTSFSGGTAAIGAGSANPLTVEQLQNNIALSIYPNPTSGNFTVNVKAGNTMTGTLKVYDAVGRMVQHSELTTGANIINSQLNSGIYHVVVHYDGQMYTNRLLVK